MIGISRFISGSITFLPTNSDIARPRDHRNRRVAKHRFRPSCGHHQITISAAPAPAMGYRRCHSLPGLSMCTTSRSLMAVWHLGHQFTM